MVEPSGTEFAKIGERAPRLQEIVDLLPNSWSCIYTIAAQNNDEFNRLIDSKKLSPFITAKEIDEATNGKKPAKQRPLTANVSFKHARNPREAAQKLKQLAAEYELSLENEKLLDALIDPEAANQKEAA